MRLVEKKQLLMERIKTMAAKNLDTINNYMIASNEKLSPVQEVTITKEFQVIYIQFIDILAYSIIGAHKRTLLINALREEIIDFNINKNDMHLPAREREKLSKFMLKEFIDMSKHYSRFKKFFPQDGEPADGTFFWEFGKRIAKILGNSKNEKHITFALKLAAETIPELQVEQVLKNSSNILLKQ